MFRKILTLHFLVTHAMSFSQMYSRNNNIADFINKLLPASTNMFQDKETLLKSDDKSFIIKGTFSESNSKKSYEYVRHWNVDYFFINNNVFNMRSCADSCGKYIDIRIEKQCGLSSDNQNQNDNVENKNVQFLYSPLPILFKTLEQTTFKKTYNIKFKENNNDIQKCLILIKFLELFPLEERDIKKIEFLYNTGFKKHNNFNMSIIMEDISKPYLLSIISPCFCATCELYDNFI